MSNYHGLAITDLCVRISPRYPYVPCRAWVAVVLNDAIKIELAVVVTPGGKTIVAFPNKRRPNGDRVCLAYPIDAAARRWVELHVLDAYDAELRSIPTDAEYREALDAGLIEPPPSSCGHPTEQVLQEAGSWADLI